MDSTQSDVWARRRARRGHAESAKRAHAAVTWPSFGSPELDAAQVVRLADFVNARLDLADHKLLLLLKAIIVNGADFDEATRDVAEAAVLGFRYSLLEPGSDSMITWSESHQLVFATAEYLAGSVFADRTFVNDGRLGERHTEAAALRLDTWLSDRFRFGFSEWFASTFQRVCAGALAMLVDHAPDEIIRTKAAMVLDIVLLDATLHSFEGVPVASSGRMDADIAKHPERSPFARIHAAAFGCGSPGFDLDDIGTLFVCRSNYHVPPVLCDLAASDEVRRVRSSQGLDLREVTRELARHPAHPRTGGQDLLRFWWGMEALVAPQTIDATIDFIQDHDLASHRLLGMAAKFFKVPKRARKATLTAMNPILTGLALQRANVQTFATRNYSLSSAQRYHPGTWGDQQHIWQARLPGDISVFGNHPGSITWDVDARPPTPSHWVGNGILPDVAQLDNVLLAYCDLRGRKGYLEGNRRELVHFYFPAAKFDETRFGVRWVAGRVGTSYLAIIGTHPLELVSEVEVVQRGTVTGYAVVLADEEEVTSMTDFVRQIKAHMLTLRGDKLVLVNPFGRYELTWRGDFVVGGQRIGTDYPRYDAHHVQTARFPNRIEVRSAGHQLVLDWDRALRRVDD